MISQPIRDVTDSVLVGKGDVAKPLVTGGIGDQETSRARRLQQELMDGRAHVVCRHR
jgi:hypothetical protein